MIKIATWNLERPTNSSIARNQRISAALKQVDADILVLTETSSAIDPGGDYTCFASSSLSAHLGKMGEAYRDGENRASIWSKYPGTRQETSDSTASVCVEVITPLGKLSVYGTVLGSYGRGGVEFESDLAKQIPDWHKFAKAGNVCIVGDFNQTFGDNYYFTQAGRQAIIESFEELKIDLLTAKIPENIDHIAASKQFVGSRVCKTITWNEDKDSKLSDHQGVCLTIE